MPDLGGNIDRRYGSGGSRSERVSQRKGVKEKNKFNSSLLGERSAHVDW